MGYSLNGLALDDIGNPAQSFSFSHSMWPDALQLAQVYGWQPAGTELRRENGETWDGNYTDCCDQLVTPADAKALAAAIARALPDIPDNVSVVFTNENSPQLKPGQIAVNLLTDSVSLLERFGGWRKKWLQGFIAFCSGANGFTVG